MVSFFFRDDIDVSSIDMSINYQIKRLWASSVPILTVNILESGVVDRNFNDALTDAALKAFDSYTNITSSTSNNQHDDSTKRRPNISNNHHDEARPSSSEGRRRRRQRTSSVLLGNIENISSSNNNVISTKVTANDNFFEYQRTRGFRLSTPSISSCDEVKELEEIHVLDAVTQYLIQLDNNKSISIANQLQFDSTCTIDMWVAVQRGKSAFHEYHVHEGAIISGVYYSNCPANCAPLILKKPNNSIGSQTANDDQSDRDDEEEVIIHPKEGQLVLFPPWLYHGVPKMNEEHNTARVSWAFNLNGRIVDPWSITRPS